MFQIYAYQMRTGRWVTASRPYDEHREAQWEANRLNVITGDMELFKVVEVSESGVPVRPEEVEG